MSRSRSGTFSRGRCIDAPPDAERLQSRRNVPYDLSASYGVPGQFEHPKMREAMARILAVAGEAQVPAGIHVVHPPVDQVRARLAEGFRFVAYGGDMLFLVPAVREAAAELNRLRSRESS